MWHFLRDFVFPGLLFAGTLLLALALGMLVVTAPWFLAGDPKNRLLHLFAHDNTVRRTTVASSLGLAVTAFVFFRPGLLRSKKSRTRRPPPSFLAGA